ncbi:MAG: NAD-dependent epimerase/dehydratase family protein [Dehalococcoidia bacterium]|nr:NAD-dependent epimerase/dehydratase family protein [Dehalococcoidia bacterium]
MPASYGAAGSDDAHGLLAACWRPVRVAVTGASGFIGSRVCRGLADAGHSVVAVVRPSSDRSALEGCDCELRIGDVTDQDSLRSAFSGADAVVHCAAVVDAYGNPWAARSVTWIGTYNVCHAATDSGSRQFVHMSTLAVYARDNPQGVRLDEDTARLMKEPPLYDTYSPNKAAAERFAADFGRNGRMSVAILRPGVVYGSGGPTVRRIADAINNRRLACVGSRHNRLPLIYVDDVAGATLAALERPPKKARAFNINGPEDVTWGRLLDAVARAMGTAPTAAPVIPVRLARTAAWAVEQWWSIRKKEGSPPLNRFIIDAIGRDSPVDISRARNELGWEPRVGLQEGVRRAVADLRSRGLEPYKA